MKMGIGNFGLIQAAAGAARGAGEGIATVGAFGLKRQMMEEMNKLETERAAMIENLRAQHESQLTGQRIAGERGIQAKGEEFQLHRQQIGIQAGVGAQTRKMQFEAGVEQGKQKTSLERARIMASGHVEAARERAVAGAKQPADWKEYPIKTTRPDPQHPGMTLQQETPGMFHQPTGTIYAQVGDKWVPWSEDTQSAQDLKGFRRPTAEDANLLRKNPLAQSPSGTPAWAIFRQRYGFLPADVMTTIKGTPQGGGASSASTSSRTGPQPIGYEPGQAEVPGGSAEEAHAAAESQREEQEAEGEANEQFHSAGADDYSQAASNQ